MALLLRLTKVRAYDGAFMVARAQRFLCYVLKETAGVFYDD